MSVSSQKKILMKPQTSTVKGKSVVDPKGKDSLPTKVVVRKLPPSLTAESFLEEVSPLAEHDYFHFEAADRSLGPFALSRAVINFKNVEDLYIFREKFDNYVFVDTRGNEYPAVVEYAPYQKIPLNSRKDHRENTLDDDPDYKKFLDSIENPEAPEPSLTIKQVIEELDAKAKERIAANNSETPLLAFINKFKLEKRRAQEKLREERRQRDLERKRIRDEERRKLREKERKETDENKQKNLSGKPSASDGDRKVDGKKGNSKPGGKAGPPSKSYGADGKPSKGGATRANRDDITVRTLPSAKSKNSKHSSTEKRPSSGKAAPAKSQPPSKANTGKASNAKDVNKAESTSPQTVLSGKQEVAMKSGSNRVDRGEVTVRSLERRTGDRNAAKSAKGKYANQDGKQDSANKSEDKKADELSDRLSSVKFKDKGDGKAADKKTERSGSVSSSTSESRSFDSSEGDGDKPKAARNTRYKDRPERAIYNPAARAAERRQKQQVTDTRPAGGGEDSKGD